MLARVWARSTLLAPFAIPGFGGLWVSAAAGSFARVVTQLTLSWVTLEATGSPLLVGVVAAMRMAPQLVLGIPAGALTDWLDRRLLTVWVNAASVVVLLGLVGLAAADLLSTALLIVASALYGALDTVRTAATQAYAYDLVRASRATSGMALTNLGVQLLGTLGGLAGGAALERFGGPPTFALIAAAVLVAAVAPLAGAPSAGMAPAGDGPSAAGRGSHARPVPASGGDGPARPHVPAATPARAPLDFGRAAGLALRRPLLAVVALAIVLAEIFGFASMTLLPIFARDVFDVGASGYGTMMAVRSGGGAIGLLLLARIGTEGQSGRVFLGAAATFGLALLLFALSPVYALALVFLAVAGIGASVLDTLGQTLLQRNADDAQRGAAMGLWVFSVGFGPIGHLALGAAATTYGAPQTQTVSGLLLVLVAAALGLHRPLRQAR